MSSRNFTIALLLALSLSSALLAQQPAKKSAPAKAPADPAAIKRGKIVFDDFCLICHLDTSTAKKIATGLKGLSTRTKFADGKPITDTSLRSWIENGGKDMPAFKDDIPPEKIRDLIAYLKSI